MPTENSTTKTDLDSALPSSSPQEGKVSAAASKSKSSAILAIIARWVLGAAFVYMGLHKVLGPAEFLGLVRQYNLTNNSFILNSIAAALPWFEVFCGLLLLLGVAVRGAALVVLAMLLPFSIVVLKRALAMAATQGLAFCAVKFDCGCGSGEIVICNKLIENSGLMLICLWLIFGAQQKLSLRYSLMKKAAPEGAAS
jgi:uncharacterized membrane protein YphA (DoxX/SURF4 family)